MAPAGLESSYRNNEVSARLTIWAERTGNGEVFESSAEFFLPNGAALSPGASWISKGQLAEVKSDEKRKFPHLCPEFVIEVMSPSERLKAAQAKMDEWIANSALLAWLIDGDNRSTMSIVPGKPVEKKSKISELAGEGPVSGFVLELEQIWTGV